MSRLGLFHQQLYRTRKAYLPWPIGWAGTVGEAFPQEAESLLAPLHDLLPEIRDNAPAA